MLEEQEYQHAEEAASANHTRTKEAELAFEAKADDYELERHSLVGDIESGTVLPFGCRLW